MKTKKTWVLLAFCTISLSVLFGVYFHPTSFAASSIAPWINSNGDSVNITDPNLFKNNFTFLDSSTIKDNGTGTHYILQNADPALEFDSNHAGNATDKLNPGANCNTDDKNKIYNDGLCAHATKYYWYWPSSDPSTPINGACEGGILVSDASGDRAGDVLSSGGHENIYINYIPTQLDASGNSCVNFLNGSLTNEVGASDLQALGSIRDYTYNGSLTLQSWGDIPVFRHYSSFLQWDNNTELSTVGVHGNGAITKVTDPLVLHNVTAHLKNNSHKGASAFASGYDFYTTNTCQSNGGLSAFVAVKTGDPTVGYLLHDNSPGGDDTSGDAYGDWYGKAFVCLLGTNVKSNPYQYFFKGGGDVAVLLSSTQNATKPPGAPGTKTPPNATDCSNSQDLSGCPSTTTPEIKCSASLLNPLSWVACPIIAAASGAVNAYDQEIQNQLDVESSTYLDETTNTGDGYYQIWSAMRYIAMSLLVIIGLVMVISQAIGAELFDAYTVRKILPRLLAAVVLISLSWPLAKYMIDVADVLGKGIRTIIFFPFKDVGTLKTSVGSDGVLALAGVGIGAVLGMVGILLFAVSALLAVFAAIVTLIIRKILIIFLVVLAPIAIVSYILPGTQKVWKMWWDNFLRLLLMFPIIMAFIAAGRVFAITAENTDKNLMGQIIMFIAYFGPYFALPMTFKMGGGLMSLAAGGIHSMSQMGTKRLNAAGMKRGAENLQNMKTGTRFNNRGLNALTSRATTRNFGLGARGKAAYNQKLDLAAAEHAKSAGGLAVQHNDDALRALTYGSAAEAKANMKNDWRKSDGSSYTDTEIDTAVGAALASGGFGRGRQIYAAQQLAATGTGYNSGNIQQVAKTIARVSHGNASQVSSLAGNINSVTKTVGRHDLAPGYGALNTLAQQEAGLAGGTANYAGAAEEAWNSGSLYQHANDKPQDIDAAISHFTPMLTSSDGDARERAGVFFNELRAMQPNASGSVKNSIQQALDANHADIESLYDSSHANYIGDSAPGVADKSSGRVEEQVYDPSTGNYTRRVTSTGTRAENARERVERTSRTYERPDPNTL